MVKIKLKVNDIEKEIDVRPNETLVEVLREKFHVKSVKASCYRGECGVCTVILNGKLVKSCLVLAPEVDGAEILTLEGISRFKEGELMQKAFIESFGFQCGFCTPAFVLTGFWIARYRPDATDEEIKEILNSLVCRCTGYKQVIQAIKLGLKYCKEAKR